MQLTLRPTGPSSRSATGANQALAGLAVLGAGLLAVHPAAPTLSEAQQRAVHLATDWTTTVGDAFDNLTALGDRISADPFPIFTELFGNQSAYGEMLGDELQEAWNGLTGIFTGYGPAQGLINLWPAVLDDLQNGEFFEAYSKLNEDFLFDMLNVTQPFFNHTEYGTGDFIDGASGIPAEMLHNLADVAEVFADYGLWKDLSEALLSPEIGMLFQTFESIGEIGQSFAGGDIADAFTGLANLPAQLADAVLNGYLPPEAGGHDQFAGLLTEGGLFDQLLVQIPQQVAEALGASTGPAGPADLAADLVAGF